MSESVDKIEEILKDSSRLESLICRFWGKVDARGSDDCWEWNAAKTEKGYGRMTCGRHCHLKAHRVSWAIHYKKSPGIMLVCHRCDNPGCVNPNHLFLGTSKDNTMDMLTKRRNSKPPVKYGECHHNTKILTADVLKILRDGRPSMDIAIEYGVSYITIRRIKTGKTWLKVDPFARGIESQENKPRRS